MGALVKNLLLFTCLLWSFTTVNAQNFQNEKDLINAYSLEANNLIWHINLNIKKLAEYQVKMNTWYTSNKNVSLAPIFVFSKNPSQNALNSLLTFDKIAPSNPAFNYQTTLNKLNKQVLLFNTFCENLQRFPREGDRDEYYKKCMAILYQIDGMAPDMVNFCYDFSLSCAINYGKEKLPAQLDLLKNTVGQAKNVIMAIRDNNPTQAKSYLTQLNNSIISSSQSNRFNDLQRIGKFDIEEDELKRLHDQVLESANLIAYWAEQYLQSNFTEAEVNPILASAILAFNVFEGKAGCSGTYNQLVGQSNTQFLFYTEEPMFFEVEEKERVRELIPTIAVKSDTVVVKKPIRPEVDKVTPVTKPVVVFDEKDITNLDGALPNNIIIMMDVSASMKITGKLPLLKESILHLVDIMRPEDRISLIAYSGEAVILIANAGIENKDAIKTVLDTLHSSGGTDILKGLEFGFLTAKNSFMKKGNNRIIIATDGEFGVKNNLLEFVEQKSAEEIYLSVFQFNDVKNNKENSAMAMLSIAGRGSYHTITSSEEALTVLMQEVKKK